MKLGLPHPYREESQKFVFLNVMCFLRSFFQDAIRMMITQANNHLEELKKSLALARSWTLQAGVDFRLMWTWSPWDPRRLLSGSIQDRLTETPLWSHLHTRTSTLSPPLLLTVRRRRSVWDQRNSPTCELNRPPHIVCNVNIKHKLIKYIKSWIQFLKKQTTCFLASSYRVHYPYSTTYKHEWAESHYIQHTADSNTATQFIFMQPI